MTNYSKKRDLYVLRLIREALNRERMQRHNAIVFNIACEDLLELGEDVLESIEKVLIEEVAPTLVDVKPCRYEPLIDLSGVLCVYFKICKESSSNRSTIFLRTLSGRLLVEALLAIWATWLGGAPPREPLPGLLYDEVLRIANEDSDVAGKKAKQLLSTYEMLRPSSN